MFLSKIREYAVIFLVGAIGYSMIEIFWRGYTHWTMSITGGVGFLLLYLTDQYMQGRNLFLQATAGALVLTSVELIAGCILDLVFHLGVWGYSNRPGNLAGEICPL